MRAKPTNEVRAATHPAAAEDFQKLAKAVLQAIVTKQKDVILKLPYFVRISEGVPKGVCIKRDSNFNWYRAKTFKLADYLYEKGYLPGDAKTLVKMTRTVTNLWGEIDRLIDKPLTEHADEGLTCDDKIFVDNDE